MSGGHLLSPFSIGYVKGWKRSVCLLVVLAIVRKLEIGASIPSNIKAGYFFLPWCWSFPGSPRPPILTFQASWGTIHASFQNFSDVKGQVQANRGGAFVWNPATCIEQCLDFFQQKRVGVISGFSRRDPHSYIDQKTSECLSFQTADHDLGELGVVDLRSNFRTSLLLLLLLFPSMLSRLGKLNMCSSSHCTDVMLNALACFSRGLA